MLQYMGRLMQTYLNSFKSSLTFLFDIFIRARTRHKLKSWILEEEHSDHALVETNRVEPQGPKLPSTQSHYANFSMIELGFCEPCLNQSSVLNQAIYHAEP